MASRDTVTGRSKYRSALMVLGAVALLLISIAVVVMLGSEESHSAKNGHDEWMERPVRLFMHYLHKLEKDVSEKVLLDVDKDGIGEFAGLEFLYEQYGEMFDACGASKPTNGESRIGPYRILLLRPDVHASGLDPLERSYCILAIPDKAATRDARMYVATETGVIRYLDRAKNELSEAVSLEVVYDGKPFESKLRESHFLPYKGQGSE